MMERLSDWDHDQFKKVCVKVANMEIAYRAVSFYLQRQVGRVLLEYDPTNSGLTNSLASFPTSLQPLLHVSTTDEL